MAHARTSISVNRGSEQPQRPHLPEDVPVKLLMPRRFDNPRKQTIPGILPRSIPYHPLFVGKLIFQPERVFPLKFAEVRHRGLCVTIPASGCNRYVSIPKVEIVVNCNKYFTTIVLKRNKKN